MKSFILTEKQFEEMEKLNPEEIEKNKESARRFGKCCEDKTKTKSKANSEDEDPLALFNSMMEYLGFKVIELEKGEQENDDDNNKSL